MRLMRTAVIGLLAATVAACASQPASQPRAEAAITKSSVLDRYGPPLKVETFEGDEFWYYSEAQIIASQRPHMSGWDRFFNAIGAAGAGLSSGRVSPGPLVENQMAAERHAAQMNRVLILRFVGETGVLKGQYWR